MQCHPDRHPGDKQAEERFKEASEAYTVLSDPDKRAQYDRFGTVSPGDRDFGEGIGTLFEDIFENFFAGGGRGRRSRAARGDDLQYELKITLEDAAKGLDTRLQIPRMERCEVCEGRGVESGSRRVPCEMCRGPAEVRRSQGFLTVARTCPKCQGEGELNRNPCPRCRGEGRQRGEHVLQIKIPAGIEDGMQLRVSGEGSVGHHGGPRGDLYVLVRIRDHELFTRHGSDLYCDVPVSFPQLALGAEVEVPTLGGPARLKIPQGSQPHEVIKLRGRGLPRLRERGHGDACYRLVLEVPQKLSAQQREALASLYDAPQGIT